MRCKALDGDAWVEATDDVDDKVDIVLSVEIIAKEKTLGVVVPFALHGRRMVDLQLVELDKVDAEGVDMSHAIDNIAFRLVG